MPRELPGFYYDAEKNRYFPIKGPVPGSSRKPAPSQKPASETIKVEDKCRQGVKIFKLLHGRELCGNTISMKKQKISFQEEYTSSQASQPLVWKYQRTERDSDGALGIIHVNMQTVTGAVGTSLLLTGGANGSVSLFDVGRGGHDTAHGVQWTAEHVFSKTLHSQTERIDSGLKDIWKLNGTSLVLQSSISSICTPTKLEENHTSHSQSTLVTTLGSDSSGGSLCSLDLGDPLDLSSGVPVVGRLREVTSVNDTIWAADWDYGGNKCVIGTNLGPMVVDLDSGVKSYCYNSGSDVLSVQFIHQGNVVLCGLRNGSILTVDIRQGHRPLQRRSRSHPRTNVNPRCTVFMPKSVSSLTSLSLYDQYFLASSMDGSIKLYDHRLTQCGAVQSYEGNVNAHMRIQLGVDPLERFVVSGGMDKQVRIWSIKSGEMLFQNKISESIPLTVCCQGAESFPRSLLGKSQGYGQEYSWGAWLGSPEALYWMQFA